MRSRSHTYLSATCVHGECTGDPYAWRNDGTARIRGACGIPFPSPLPRRAKGPPERSRRSAAVFLPFSFSLFFPFIFLFLRRWPISRSECEETAKSERGAGPEGAGKDFPARIRIDCGINDRLRKLLTAELPRARARCLATP
jgi:hypothetical protein